MMMIAPNQRVWRHFSRLFVQRKRQSPSSSLLSTMRRIPLFYSVAQRMEPTLSSTPTRLSLRQNFFSSSTASTHIHDKNVTTMASLKNMIKPFFLKCHPDVQSTLDAKRVNLQALQTINGFLDVLESTLQGKVVEWPDLLEVEFVITIEERIKKEIRETNSRRKVELALPPPSLRDAAAGGTRDPLAARRLQHFVRLEFAKILKVAGLPVPIVLEGDGSTDSIDAAWDHELDFVDDGTRPTRTFQPRSRRQSRYEASRDRFVKSLDWNRIHRLCREAEEDMEADLATQGSLRNNPTRRREIISNILSKVRVADDSIPMVEQLIAFRRLSLILQDNFDDLYLEDMGRMWENLVIVLKGHRDYSTSSSSLRKRSKRSLETGFQFSYSNNGVVTIHIPIDFGNEEVVAELDRNLWDFHNLVGDGIDFLYPKWFTE